MNYCKIFSPHCTNHCQRIINICIKRYQQTVSNKLILSDFKANPVAKIKKKNAKPPFLKNFFVGIFDNDMLAYPEVADTTRYLALEHIIPLAKKFLSKEGVLNKDEKVSDETISNLKDLGLFGCSIPSTYGGLDYSHTEYGRLLEIASENLAVGYMLMVHQTFGARAVLKHGNEQQKIQYLPRLTSGEWLAGFCAAESVAGFDYSSMTSIAELSNDGTHYILNGTKVWVVNGNQANFFIVAAPTEINPVRAKLNNLLTTFLVERNSEGIYCDPPEETIGVHGVDICKIRFDNVIVPIENVLGKVGNGFNICNDILNSEAYVYGSMISGFLRKLFNETVDHVIRCQQFQTSLKDMNAVKRKLAEISMQIYAVESMTYLTTGIIDLYENPDCELESLVTKIYAGKAMQFCVDECLKLIGSKAYLKGHPFEQMFRDSRIKPTYDISLDFTEIYVAVLGLNYAGSTVQDFVSKMRNPLTFPGTAFKIFFETQRNLRNDPKLTLHLNEYLHPSLNEVAVLLERTVLRFKFCILVALANDGMKITDNHIVLRRLTEILMNCYAMTAVLGRASRSYCCGTLNHDHEMTMAHTFVRDTYTKMNIIVKEIIDGPFETTDANTEKIADIILKNKGHATEHPLSRNII